MKLKILKPSGWCVGVKHSVEQLDVIIAKHKSEDIYLLGDLVHNHAIMSRFKMAGIHIVSDLKMIEDRNAVVVLPAHGISEKQLDYAKANFKYVYDLTCKILLSNYKIIKQLANKSDVLYYGYKNHPESKAILSLTDNIILVSSYSQLMPNKKYTFVNQSTIPLSAVQSIFDKLKQRTKNIKYVPTTCNATQQRHHVITRLRNVDCLIVCGDEQSNNAIELVKLAQQHHIPAVLVSNELNAYQFKAKKNIRYAIISGTSVQPTFFKSICTILKNKK